jgi:3-hydroxybutyryl-CoA dehydrogenase
VSFSTLSGDDLSVFAGAGLVVEAIVEDLAVKRKVFSALESTVAADVILATTTSSLSVTAIAAACRDPRRVIGAHFFNPATRLPLVEIVPGYDTSATTVGIVRSLIDSWGKVTVVAKDTPGFIVNRIARPFYGEALRLLEEGVADTATIDWAMRELGGFRMGPFELMDLIGLDVNYAVSQTVFEAFHYDPRYRPSLIQRQLVDAKRLGRKTGKGFYGYGDETSAPEPNRDGELGQDILDRVLAMLINEAADALFLGVASREDIDLAMTKGVNYPKGLLQWADEIGIRTVLERLDALQSEYGDDRYRPSPLLRRMVRDGRTFYL